MFNFSNFVFLRILGCLNSQNLDLKNVEYPLDSKFRFWDLLEHVVAKYYPQGLLFLEEQKNMILGYQFDSKLMCWVCFSIISFQSCVWVLYQYSFGAKLRFLSVPLSPSLPPPPQRVWGVGGPASPLGREGATPGTLFW